MSGIIGGVGSKSGVIGTTEIDYEEGTWTPAIGGVNQTAGNYRKIGGVVMLFASFQVAGASPNSQITGNPFTPSVSSANALGGYSQIAAGAATIDIASNGVIYTYGTNTTGGVNVANGDYVQFSALYITA